MLTLCHFDRPANVFELEMKYDNNGQLNFYHHWPRIGIEDLGIQFRLVYSVSNNCINQSFSVAEIVFYCFDV